MEYFRVRRCEVGRNRVTLDNETFFSDVSMAFCNLGIVTIMVMVTMMTMMVMMVVMVMFMVMVMMGVQVEDLVEQYKQERGALPCRLGLASARPLTQTEVRRDLCKIHINPHSQLQEVLGNGKSKLPTRRRKGNVDMNEMLIINRE